MSAALDDLQRRLGHRFQRPELLARAITHRSYGADHNERLEFLGDAVVNLLAAEALYQRWPKADEGVLTRARAELVREASLAAIARELELGQRLTLGPGELKSGGYRRDSILADALEAVVASIYLDAGYQACRARVLPWFEQALAALPVVERTYQGRAMTVIWLPTRETMVATSRALRGRRLRRANRV